MRSELQHALHKEAAARTLLETQSKAEASMMDQLKKQATDASSALELLTAQHKQLQVLSHVVSALLLKQSCCMCQ